MINTFHDIFSVLDGNCRPVLSDTSNNTYIVLSREFSWVVICRYTCTALFAWLVTCWGTRTLFHWVTRFSWDSIGEEVSEVGSHFFCCQFIWSKFFLFKSIHCLKSNKWWYYRVLEPSYLLGIERVVLSTFPTWKQGTHIICLWRWCWAFDPVISETWITWAWELTFGQVSNLNGCNPIIGSCWRIHRLNYLISCLPIPCYCHWCYTLCACLTSLE